MHRLGPGAQYECLLGKEEEGEGEGEGEGYFH